MTTLKFSTVLILLVFTQIGHAQILTNITSVQPTNLIFDPLPAGSDHAFYRAYSP